MRGVVVSVVAASVFLFPAPAFAQAPDAGPLILRLPATPRTAALGDAWVAGRDQEVLFYNPAQLIGARSGLDLSVMRIGSSTTSATVGSIYAAGKWSLTLGWGAQILNFRVDPNAPYPYSPELLLATGSDEAFGAIVSVGGAIVFKGFRIGAAGKYAVDRVPGAGSATPANHGGLLFDVGVARTMWGGVFAGSVQNLGPAERNGVVLALPRQALAGWSMARGVGPLDMAVYTQVLFRDGWTSPGAGVEIGYSWIEGYNVAVRAGARRPETAAGKPISLGLALTGDRLTIEYAIQFFDGGRTSNGVTVRWR